MTRLRLAQFGAFIAAASLAGCGQGADDPVVASSSARASPSGKALISSEVQHDISAPLLLLAPAPRSTVLREHRVLPIPPRPPGDAVAAPGAGMAAGQATESLEASLPASPASGPLIATPLTNFEGIGHGFSGPAGTFSVTSAPPDTDGAVGPNHLVQIVNTGFAVFSKTGTVLYGPVATNTLWSGFGGGCQANNDGDAVVAYDRTADRWVITQFSVSTAPFLQCVAVSATPDPTGPYFRYAFQYTDFPDYPKLGVWPDAYYVTFNMFNAAGTAFLGGKVCAYNRSAMLAGQVATQQCFNVGTGFGGLLAADLDGARLPPAGAPNPILALGTTTSLAFWTFHVDWATPANSTLTGPTALSVPAFSVACAATGTCIPQPGTTQQLDSLGDRLMNRLAYRNFGDHESLVATHAVVAGSSVGVRWYEVRLTGGVPGIYQQGTYAPDSGYRWMSSAAMDQAGNMALGFSLSSSTVRPAIHYTARLAGDAVGTMSQGEGTVIDGAGVQTGASSLSRWGDYSAMLVDPTDDCTFWYTNQYQAVNGIFNWHTRIASFKLPGCPALPGTWTGNASMPAARLDGASATASNGRVYVMGGFNGAYLNSNTEYDPTTNTWTPKATMPTARRGLAAAAEGAKVYAAGGTDGVSVLATMEEYDSALGAWTTKAAMPTPRRNPAAAVVNGKIYVIGGQSTVSSAGYLATVEEYDPVANTWTAKASMPTARAFLGAAAVGGKIYAAGGLGSGGTPATVDVYDPVANTWAAGPSMPQGRYGVAAGALNGRFYVVGGYGPTAMAEVEEYDPATGTWTVRASMSMARAYPTASSVGGKLYVSGGFSGTAYLATAEVYDPGTRKAVQRDLDGNGESDILWRSTSGGQVYAYLANGTSGTTFQPEYLTTQTADWQIAGIGDFNGDGKSDLLWRSTSTGAVYVYVANGSPGTATFQPGYLTSQTADWVIVGIGDFDGDGKSDILWRSTSTGVVYAWMATGTSGTTFQPAYLTTQTSDWQIVGIGDFNGDGKSDLLWRSTSTGAVYVYVANGAPGTASFQPGYLTTQTAEWQIVGIGDFDGDGKSDILWRSTFTGAVYVYLATGTSGTTFQPAYLTTQTSDWQIVGIGDFNGDGKSDLLWRGTSTGAVYVWVASGAPGTASFQPAYLTTQTADWQIVRAN